MQCAKYAMLSSSFALINAASFSIKSTAAASPLFTSAGVGPDKIPITSPASFVFAFAAPP